MDILKFLGLDYIVALLMILYFVVLGISIPKIRKDYATHYTQENFRQKSFN